jgi:hypothetical protein
LLKLQRINTYAITFGAPSFITNLDPFISAPNFAFKRTVRGLDVVDECVPTSALSLGYSPFERLIRLATASNAKETVIKGTQLTTPVLAGPLVSGVVQTLVSGILEKPNAEKYVQTIQTYFNSAKDTSVEDVAVRSDDRYDGVLKDGVMVAPQLVAAADGTAESNSSRKGVIEHVGLPSSQLMAGESRLERQARGNTCAVDDDVSMNSEPISGADRPVRPSSCEGSGAEVEYVVTDLQAVSAENSLIGANSNRGCCITEAEVMTGPQLPGAMAKELFQFGTQVADVLQPVLSGVNNHNMKRYLGTVQSVFNRPNGTPGGERNVKVSSYCNEDQFRKDTVLTLAAFTKGGYFKVEGRGKWAGIVRASIRVGQQAEAVECVVGNLAYTVQRKGACALPDYECQFSMIFKMPGVHQPSIMNIRGCQNDIHLAVFNGLQTFQLSIPNLTFAKSVAVLGATGHGKSQLLKGLLAQVSGQEVEQTRPLFREVAADLAETIILEGAVFYECGAVGTLDDEYKSSLQDILKTYPPTIYVIVVKSNQRVNEKGLIKLMQLLVEGRPTTELPFLTLVVTNDPVEVADPAWLEEVKRELLYDKFPRKACFHVNSAISTTMKLKPVNMDILLTHLRDVLHEAPPANPVSGRTWPQFFWHLITDKPVVSVLSVVATGAWIMVTKLPPPIPL